MRKVEYELLPAMGSGTLKRSGSLKDLLLEIPNFRMFELMPPMRVLNAVLREGVADAGMSGGCQWAPFEITQSEYEELVQSFSTIPNNYFRSVDVPTWVETPSDWMIWTLEHVRGVPTQEHRRLTAEYEALERRRKAASDSGDSELAESLFVEVIQAGTKLSDFVMAHLRKDEGR
jgi:hypothetical protein